MIEKRALGLFHANLSHRWRQLINRTKTHKVNVRLISEASPGFSARKVRHACFQNQKEIIEIYTWRYNDGHIKTAEQRTVIPLYMNTVIGTAPPSPLLAVPNITTHLSTASVST